jgi:predicted transcriptional regulator YheO
MLCSASGNDSPSDKVSRSGGKRRNHADLTTQMSSQTLSSSKTLKKTRVSMQLDFNSPSGTTRSPVVKKLRDDVMVDSKEAALSVQKLLNIAA